jgi:NAD(P)H-flavin reductase
VIRETSDTFTLALDVSSRHGGFLFAAGQFNMLYVFGAGEAPISVSGDPDQPQELLHTVRAVGAVTRRLKELRRGDTIGIRGPFGKGWPVEEAKGRDVLIVAGGLGLAPLRPAIYQILNHRSEFKRVILLYGARTPDDLLFRKELARWRGRLDLEVGITVDRAGPDWRGRIDVVPALLASHQLDPAQTVALVCGPEVMMRFTVRELELRGIPRESIYLSMERNMKCGVGLCGHCQLVPFFICKDGPVMRFDRLAPFLNTREL